MTTPQGGGCEAIQDLLGAYALDAVDPDEATLISNHLATCPRCQQEVNHHRETVLLLAATGGPAPDQLWDRIAGAIESKEPPAGDTVPTLISTTKTRGRSPWARPLQAVALAAAAAVVVAVGVQAVRIGNLDHKVNQLSAANHQAGDFPGPVAVLVDPSARHLTLTSTSVGEQPVGQLVILPAGPAYLVGAQLPPLAAAGTYQLWAIVDGRPVSVSLLGGHPKTVAFRVDPSAPASEYLVTAEPPGGVVAPTTSPVAKAVA
jgi:Anti-sigma-K factor rskA, C-terminal/Putative zinc-finger